jgi:serine kinase of HPr protein (carbohydrate metabolism regulator)
MNGIATVHAGAVLVGETGVLVRGASGSGKSSLILALLAARPETAWLVADDRVALRAAHGRLVAAVPPSIAGLLEIRGVGIVARPFVSPAVVRLVVDLVPREAAPRLPSEEEAAAEVLGVHLPRLVLPAASGDGGLRVLAAVAGLRRETAESKASEASCVAESIGQDTAFGAAGGAGRDRRLAGAAVRRGTGRRHGA